MKKKSILIVLCGLFVGVGCGTTPSGINQTSKAKPGTLLWEFETGGAIGWSFPAISADGTVYIGSEDKKVYALNGATGTKKWEFVTGGKVWSSPAIGADGTVYVGSDDKKVYALNGKTGPRNGSLRR